MSNSKPRTLYARFRRAYGDMELHGYGLDKDFVVISRAAWDRSERMLKEYNRVQEAIRRPN